MAYPQSHNDHVVISGTQLLIRAAIIIVLTLASIIGPGEGAVTVEFQQDYSYTDLLPIENVPATSATGTECFEKCANDPMCSSFFTAAGDQCYLHDIIYGLKGRLVATPGAKYFRLKCDNCPLEKGYYKSRLHNLCIRMFPGQMSMGNTSDICHYNDGRLITLPTIIMSKWVVKTISFNIEDRKTYERVPEKLFMDIQYVSEGYHYFNYHRDDSTFSQPTCEVQNVEMNDEHPVLGWRGQSWGSEVEGSDVDIPEITSIKVWCPIASVTFDNDRIACVPKYSQIRGTRKSVRLRNYPIIWDSVTQLCKQTPDILDAHPKRVKGETVEIKCDVPILSKYISLSSADIHNEDQCEIREVYGTKNVTTYTYLGAFAGNETGVDSFVWLPTMTPVAKLNDYDHFWKPNFYLKDLTLVGACLVLDRDGWMPDECEFRQQKITLCQYNGENHSETCGPVVQSCVSGVECSAAIVYYLGVLVAGIFPLLF